LTEIALKTTEWFCVCSREAFMLLAVENLCLLCSLGNIMLGKIYIRFLSIHVTSCDNRSLWCTIVPTIPISSLGLHNCSIRSIIFTSMTHLLCTKLEIITWNIFLPADRSLICILLFEYLGTLPWWLRRTW
jgi:hypothetical protein